MLDCRLNDPNVSVELYRRKQDNLPFLSTDRVYPRTDTFVKQNGQNFTITGLASRGKFKFLCRATAKAGTPPLEKEVRIERALGLKQQ